MLAEHFAKTGASRTSAFRSWAVKLNCHPRTVRKMRNQREVWQQQVELAERTARVASRVATGNLTGSLARLQNKKKGKRERLPGEQERLAIEEWALAEEQNGHRLDRQDLFAVFDNMVQFAAAFLEEQQAALSSKGDELSKLDQTTLAFCKVRLASSQAKG